MTCSTTRKHIHHLKGHGPFPALRVGAPLTLVGSECPIKETDTVGLLEIVGDPGRGEEQRKQDHREDNLAEFTVSPVDHQVREELGNQQLGHRDGSSNQHQNDQLPAILALGHQLAG
ncbi:MAG: hypothetical protein VXA38_05420 [Aquiluna sp.]